MSDPITPFFIAIPDEDLLDLKKRLSTARLPRQLDLEESSAKWEYGAPTEVVRDLVEYWASDKFDWRKIERNLNETLPQFTTSIDAGEPHGEITIHFVHKRSNNPKAIPLLFVHGWPGNFAEVMKMIGQLTNPSDPKDPAFHVVSPSLPGFCFSHASASPGLGLKTTALILDNLMKKLGYPKYIAQGGDWGALVIRSLAIWHQDSCKGTLSNMLIAGPKAIMWQPLKIIKILLGTLGAPGGYSAPEMQGLQDIQNFLKHEGGYQEIQGTKPQTLAYGLTDSPVGLLAWIREKLEKWTDNYQWTNDEILMWVMLYWFSAAGPVGSVRFYKDARGIGGGKPGTEDEREITTSRWSPTPLGVVIFPKEVYKMPDDFGGILQPLKYFKRHDRGGHFAAWEVPELLLEDIRRFGEMMQRDDSSLQ